ncbi:MAG: peptidylprolyl isomerase [Polyangiaceae bacterium]
MSRAHLLAAALAALTTACEKSATDAPGTGGATSSSSADATTSSTTTATTADTGSSSSSGEPITQCPADDTTLPTVDLGTGKDPEMGDFTMEEALAGLPEGPGPLRAIIDTEMGSITCELFPESAPKGVANFVGLARGRRPFRKGTHWFKGTRFYDGLIFHRVIDNFVAQGGDPLGEGTGGPGYKFADEIDPALSHTPGTLAYANSGPHTNTNGSQFYIVAEVDQSGLDGKYVIFGHCAEVDVVKAITEVMTDANDKPLVPIHMNSIAITRCAP